MEWDGKLAGLTDDCRATVLKGLRAWVEARRRKHGQWTFVHSDRCVQVLRMIEQLGISANSFTYKGDTLGEFDANGPQILHDTLTSFGIEVDPKDIPAGSTRLVMALEPATTTFSYHVTLDDALELVWLNLHASA
jgi:hypothetical protein